MTINQQIDKLKSQGNHYAAGTLAAVNCKDRSYGCHFGMRHNLDGAKEAFYAGYDDFTARQRLRAALASN